MLRTNVTRGAAGIGLLLAVVLAGCGGAASSPYAPGEGTGTAGGGPQPAASRAPGFGAGGDSGRSGSNGNPPAAPRDETKIVRTGSMSLRVGGLDAAVNEGRTRIQALGGYVGASHQTNDGGRSTATITYRIPSDRWEDALAALRKLGQVLDEQTNAVEVTAQLVDLNARIDNLRASEKALQAIAQRATKISDVLEVERRLSDVRGQIEQLDAQRAHLSDQATFGTLTVSYGLEVKAVTEASKGWDPAAEVDRASASLIGFLQSLTSAGIWFAIVWLPILLTIGAIAGLTAFGLRRLGVLGRPSPRPPLPTDA